MIPSHDTSAQPVCFTLVDRPGPSTLVAISRAAALMALADGKAELCERAGLLRFLRSRDLLQHIGRKNAVSAYEAEVGRAATESELLEALGPQPTPRAASLALTAAAYVAAADGHTDVTELRLLRRLRERFAVGPIQVPALESMIALGVTSEARCDRTEN